MGRKSTVTEHEAERILDLYRQGKSRSEIASAVGINIGRVNRFISNLGQAAAPIITTKTEIVERAGAGLWDTKAALDDNYERALNLLTKLETGVQEVNGQFVTSTPIATQVAAIKEVREHIKTSLTLLKLMVDVDEVRKFQQAVLDAIGEADDATKQRILAKLQERRAMEFALF